MTTFSGFSLNVLCVVNSYQRTGKVLRGITFIATRLGGTQFPFPFVLPRGSEDGVALGSFQVYLLPLNDLNCEFIPLSRAK